MLTSVFPECRLSTVVDLHASDPDTVIDRFCTSANRLGPELTRVFRKDIVFDHLLLEIQDVTVAEIIIDCGSHSYSNHSPKVDQVYYFCWDNQISCLGETFWTSYHPFYPDVKRIIANCNVNKLPFYETAFFIGSRDNFTHSLMDYLPAFLFAEEHGFAHKIPLYFGLSSKMEQDMRSYLSNGTETGKFQGLEFYELAINSSIRVRLTHFKKLYALRHMSIYKVYSYLKSLQPAWSSSLRDFAKKDSTVFLARENPDRIINQDLIQKEMSDRGADILKGLYGVSLSERRQLLGNYSTIICPPGSDNINALVFGPDNAQIIQMFAPPDLNNKLQVRLFAYSGLRYILPALDRIDFWMANKTVSTNTGIWDSAFVATPLTKCMDVKAIAHALRSEGLRIT